ncbi:MAG TPA: NlpC/P60 family protein [Gemmatimonadaceae bacterium]
MNEVLIVRSAIAPMCAEPRAGSEQVSQTLAGHRLTPLEEREQWVCARSMDGYQGWVHRGYLGAVGEREAEKRFATGRVSLGCVVTELDGRRRALPLGAVLADDAYVETGVAFAPVEMAGRFPRTPLGIAHAALQFFEGTPYQWGGLTPWGADCSGMVQATLGLHGIRMPRDARLQAEHGELVDGGLAALRAADLLYFSDRPDGRITHVAMALDERRIVHLAIGRGGYAVERLDDVDDPYVRGLVERFRFAKRL